MTSIAPIQDLVQDSALWEATDEAEGLAESLTMISPDMSEYADLRVSEEHKYIFAEFSGFSGETLLESIVEAILPRALARTWQVTMSFGGSRPWAGPKAIAKRAGRAERTIQEDLQHFEEFGLMEMQEGLRPLKEGEAKKSIRVDYKDFSRLYHFAHEYYEWTRTPLFQLYQPTKRDCHRLMEQHMIYEAMQQDAQLLAQIQGDELLYQKIIVGEQVYQKVRRYAIYQRALSYLKKMTLDDIAIIHLNNAKKFPDRHPARSLAAESAPYETQKKDKTNILSSPKQVSNVSNYTFSVNKSLFDSNNNSLIQSNNESIKTIETADRIIVEEHSFAGKQKDADSAQIENVPSSTSLLMIKKENKAKEVKKKEREILSFPFQDETQRNENLRGQNAKQAYVEGDQEFLIEEKKLKRTVIVEGETYEFGESVEERDARLERNEEIVLRMKRISGATNDQSPASTLTRVCRLFERSGLDIEVFLDMIEYARDRTKRLEDKQIRCRGANGQANRMPLLLNILEKTTKIGLDGMQAIDQAFQDDWASWREEKKQQAEQKMLDEINRLFPPSSPSTADEDEDQLDFASYEDQCAVNLDDKDQSAPEDQEQDALALRNVSNADHLPEAQAAMGPTDAPIEEAIIPQQSGSVVTWQEVQQQAEQRFLQQVNSACSLIEQTVGDKVFLRNESCPSCGSILIWKIPTGTGLCFSCICCDPPIHWSPRDSETVLAIQAKIPSLDDCDREVDNFLTEQGSAVELPSPDPGLAQELVKCAINHEKIEAEAKMRHDQAWQEARLAIRALTGKMVFPSGGCLKSGCKAKIVVGTRGHCACCDLPSELDPDLCDQIRQIVAEVPTLEQFLDFASQLVYEKNMEMMDDVGQTSRIGKTVSFSFST